MALPSAPAVPEFQLPAEFIARHGTAFEPWTLDDARSYTRWLSRVHYENFTVVSWLLPRRLHQDFFNVYAFCRWADDLGDEFEDPQQSLELLNWWRSELLAMYKGRTRHPVFVALRPTVERHGIPPGPFADLIEAFVQDQTVTRYDTWAAVLGYCRCSANPVGRLVLQLCGYTDPERIALSGATCTALQLANFWQDVRRDWDLGRVYIPREEMVRHGYSEQLLKADIARGRASEAFRTTLRECVRRAQELFEAGLPLPQRVGRRLGFDIELFTRGGTEVLQKIRAQGYDVIAERPKLRKMDRVRLALQALLHRFPRGTAGKPAARHAFR